MADILKMENVSKKKKILFLVGVSVVLGICWGDSLSPPRENLSRNLDYPLTQTERNVIDILGDDEIEKILSNSSTEFSLSELGITETISSKDLLATYKRNEIAADNRFKGKFFIIKGSVSEISKDFSNSPFLQLNTNNQFSKVHAYIDKHEVANLADIERGNRISLICEGNGIVMGSPILKSCRYAFSYLKIKMVQLVEEFLDGQESDSIKTASYVSLGIFLARNLSSGSICHTASNNECRKNVVDTANSLPKTPEKKAEYVAVIRELRSHNVISGDLEERMLKPTK